MASCAHGECRADFEESRRRAGITRESVWLQSTPAGDMAIVLFEADDLASAMGTLASSQQHFDQWFRGHIKDVHGIDLAEGMTPPQPMIDFHA